MDIQYCIYLMFGFSHSLDIMNNAILCQAFGEHIFLIIFAIYSGMGLQDTWQFHIELVEEKTNYFPQ